MFVINATCNGCRLVALYFGALNSVFNTWVFIPTKSGLKLKSCGNTNYVVDRTATFSKATLDIT